MSMFSSKFSSLTRQCSHPRSELWVSYLTHPNCVYSFGRPLVHLGDNTQHLYNFQNLMFVDFEYCHFCLIRWHSEEVLMFLYLKYLYLSYQQDIQNEHNGKPEILGKIMNNLNMINFMY